jgi:hypothetical protein
MKTKHKGRGGEQRRYFDSASIFYNLNLALAKVAPDMKKRRMGSNRIKRLITVRPDTRKKLRKKLCLLKTF